MPFTLLFIHSFLNGFALVLFEATANTMFLSFYDSDQLPFVYILTAVLSVVLGVMYTKLENKLHIRNVLRVVLLVILSIIFIFFVVLKLTESNLAAFIIMVFKDSIWVFVGLEFSILLSMIFNIRQGKRLFGMILSGEILAGIIAGFLVGHIIEIIDVKDLLLVSTIILGLSFFFLMRILKLFSDKFDSEDDSYEDDKPIEYSEIYKNNYYVLFFAVSILAFFIFYFIDYIFYHEVNKQITSQKELAEFFGMFFAMLNIVNLFSSLYVSGKMLSRFGIGFGLLAIPVMSFTGVGFLTFLAGTSVAFGLLILIKLLSEVLDISVMTATFRILYQPINVKIRSKIIAFRETVVEPLSMGLAGVLLVVLSEFENINIVYFSIIVISLLWIGLSLLLKKEYISSLQNMLDKHSDFDAQSLYLGMDHTYLLEGLKSDNDIKVLYYFDILEKIEYENINDILLELVDHESPVVRKEITKKLSLKYIDLFESILDERLQKEADSEIKSTLILTYAKVHKESAINKISNFLEADDIEVLKSTLIALIKYCGEEGKNKAILVLDNFSSQKDENEVILVLQVVSQTEVLKYENFLEECFNSDNKDIKKEAYFCVSKLNKSKYIEKMVEELDNINFKHIAIEALENYGALITDELIKTFEKTDSLNRKLALLKVIGKIRNDAAAQFLLTLINKPIFRNYALEKLFKNDYTIEDKKQMKRLISKSVDTIVDLMRTYLQFDKEKYKNSYIVLGEMIDEKIYSLFLILGFNYKKSVMTKVKNNFTNKLSRPYSVELVDNIVDMEIKKIIMPLLDDISIESKLRYYKNNDAKEINISDKIRSLLRIEDSPSTFKYSLIYEIGLNKDKEYEDLIKNLMLSGDELVKETATWAEQQLKRV